MRILLLALVGVVALFLAGFVRASEQAYGLGVDVVFGLSYALGGLGLATLLAVGVALGIRLGRD